MKKPVIKPFSLDWSGVKRDVPVWFRDAKFGIFLHWGPYSVPAYRNEWYSRNMYCVGLDQHRYHVETYGPLSDFGYKDFFKDFTGEKFDPEEWAEIIARSGAKYAGPVTEHADNFSLWDSKVNPVNSVNYGPKRDITGEMAKAIKAKGLKFLATFHHQWLWGWFMSTDPDADVYVPENEIFYGKATPLETNRYIPWRLPDDEFNKSWMQKVIEVVDAYDPDVVYFDSRACIIEEKYRLKIADHLYNGPNGNIDKVITYKLNDFPDGVGVLDVERGIFSGVHEEPWQTDDRLEDNVTWCYIKDAKYRPAKHIIGQLCEVVSKNGNLLLNVGPKADGTIPPEAVSILYEIGDWLSVYGEAIYGTRPFEVFGEFAKETESSSYDVKDIEKQLKQGIESNKKEFVMEDGAIRFTTKGNVLYAIVHGNPDVNEVEIKSLAEGKGLASKTINSIDIINGAPNLEWSRDDRCLRIKIKGSLPSNIANVFKITYKP